MARGSLLRAQLRNSWWKVVHGPYSRGLINSERGLQVYFCIELLQSFRESGVTRRLFVEPAIRIEGKLNRYPDLVICNMKSIIGVIEFKYLPRYRPSASKDLRTLDLIASARHGVTIENERFRGKSTRSRSYPVVKDAVLCWAGIYSGRALSLDPAHLASLGPRFMRLDALTRKGEDPEVVSPKGEASAI